MPDKKKTDPHYEQQRREVATAALQGMLAADIECYYIDYPMQVAKHAVCYADALLLTLEAPRANQKGDEQ